MVEGERAVKDVGDYIRSSNQSAAGGASVSSAMPPQGAEREQEVDGRGQEVRHSPGVRAEPLGLE